MQPSLWISVAFAVTLLLTVVLKFWLASRQMRHVAAHRGAVPAAFADTVTLAAHQKAADYTIVPSARFGLRHAGLRHRRCCWAGRCWAAWMHSTPRCATLSSRGWATWPTSWRCWRRSP